MPVRQNDEIDVLGLKSGRGELRREPASGGPGHESPRAVSRIEQDQLLPRVDDHRREARPVFVDRQQVAAHQLIDGALSVVLADERPGAVDERFGVGDHGDFEGTELEAQVFGLQGP